MFNETFSVIFKHCGLFVEEKKEGKLSWKIHFALQIPICKTKLNSNSICYGLVLGTLDAKVIFENERPLKILCQKG